MESTQIRLFRESDGACTVEGAGWAHRVSTDALGAVLVSARRLVDVYEDHRHAPLLDPAEARALGQQLADTFLPPLYAGSMSPARQVEGALLISSTDADLLNLPWELLPGRNDTFLTADPRWSIRRTTRSELPSGEPPRVARPLRILFAACAPADQPELDFEKEEEAMFRVVVRLGDRVHLDIAEAGTFDELRDLISEHQPHIVHLSGHGALRDGVGHFYFEDERGDADPRDAHEMAFELFAGRGVRLVFVSGCQTAQAKTAGICQRLTQDGHVPMALGWGASIGDHHATDFAREFYHELAAGHTVDAAFGRACVALLGRCKLKKSGFDLLDASFALPQMYAGASLQHVIDESLEYQRPARSGVQRTLLGDNIQGLREGFVGRRRILQRTRPPLRSGEKHILLLTGIGGAGKSTLATRLANRFQENGYKVAAIRARETEAIPFGLRILAEIADACQRLDLERDEQMLRDGNRPIADRLRLAVKVLNDAKILLVLDNLESILAKPPGAPTWLDTEFAVFVDELLRRLTGQGRALLTCRYVPIGFKLDALNVLHEPLLDFSKASFFKYLLRDEAVAGRMERRELGEDLLELFHEKLGGTPRFVKQACAILAVIDPDDLHDQLESMDDPHRDLTDEQLWELQQEYFRELFLPQLYDGLSLEHRTALSRIAVSTVPLPLDAVAAVSGLDEVAARGAIEASLARALIQRFGEQGQVPLFAIYPLQRGFLVDATRLDEVIARAAHRETAVFLKASLEADLRDSLHLSVEGVLACMAHAERAGDAELYRWAALHFSRILHRTAEYRTARTLLKPFLGDNRDPDMLIVYADVAYALGAWNEARDCYAEALIDQEHGVNRTREAAIWHNVATIDLEEGKYDDARHNFKKSLAIEQEIGNLAGEIVTWHNIANIDLEEGKYDDARVIFKRNLKIQQGIGFREGEAATWHSLASIDLNERKYRDARWKFDKALELRQEIGDRAARAVTLLQIASIDLEEEVYVDARLNSEKALNLQQEIGDRAGEAQTWQQIAFLDHKERKYDDARWKLDKALNIHRELGNCRGEAETWHSLASIDLNERKFCEARWKFDKALELRREIGESAARAATLLQITSIDLEEGKYDEARRNSEKALKLQQEIGDLTGEAATWGNLASIDLHDGEYDDARLSLDKALRIHQELGVGKREAAIWHNLASILLKISLFALGRGRGDVAIQLFVIAYWILVEIDSADQQIAQQKLALMSDALGLDQEGLAVVMQEAAEAYNKDRCAALVCAAFEAAHREEWKIEFQC